MFFDTLTLLALVSIPIIFLISAHEEAPSQDIHCNWLAEKTLQNQPENITTRQLHAQLRVKPSRQGYGSFQTWSLSGECRRYTKNKLPIYKNNHVKCYLIKCGQCDLKRHGNSEWKAPLGSRGQHCRDGGNSRQEWEHKKPWNDHGL